MRGWEAWGTREPKPGDQRGEALGNLGARCGGWSPGDGGGEK